MRAPLAARSWFPLGRGVSFAVSSFRLRRRVCPSPLLALQAGAGVSPALSLVSSSSDLEVNWSRDFCTQLIPAPAHHLGNTYVFALMLSGLAAIRLTAKYFPAGWLFVEGAFSACYLSAWRLLLLPGLVAKGSKSVHLSCLPSLAPVKHTCSWSLTTLSGRKGSLRWSRYSAL